VSRQEAAAVVARLLDGRAPDTEKVLGAFSDASAVGAWARDAVAYVAEKGIMKGYPDGTFRPDKALTRAEAVTVLDLAYRVMHNLVLAAYEPGIYGPAEEDETVVMDGNVLVDVPNVVLRNMVISGDLQIGEGVGDGDVTLRGVTVLGTTVINGGGAESIHIENSLLASVVIEKRDGNVRVVVSGATEVREVVLNSGATLQEVDLEGEGFGNISVSLTEEGTVVLAGEFASVQVEAAGVIVEIQEGTVQNLEVSESAEGAKIAVQANAVVETVTVNAPVEVAGEGAVKTAVVNREGVTFEKSRKPSPWRIRGSR